MQRVFLIDTDERQASQLADAIRQCGYRVIVSTNWTAAAQFLRERIPICDHVLVVGRTADQEEVTALHKLIEAARCLTHSAVPTFLFFSCGEYRPFARLQIEQMGVRYVHI